MPSPPVISGHGPEGGTPPTSRPFADRPSGRGLRARVGLIRSARSVRRVRVIGNPQALRLVINGVSRVQQAPPELEGPESRAPPEAAVSRRFIAGAMALLVAAASLLLLDRAFRAGAPLQPGVTPSRAVVSNGLIAFTGAHAAIYTMTPDGGSITNLTGPYEGTVVVAAYDARWSPDGRQIAFDGYSEAGGYSSTGGANYDVYVMNADGTGVTNLTTSPADVASEFSQINPKWSPDGRKIASGDGTPCCVAVNGDGSIVVAGTAAQVTSNPNIVAFKEGGAIVKYTASGALDRSFGRNGVVTTQPEGGGPRAMVLQPDGKIVVAGGQVASEDTFGLARYTGDGVPDETFGNHGWVSYLIGVASLTLQADGNILAGGSTETSTAGILAVLARFRGGAAPRTR